MLKQFQAHVAFHLCSHRMPLVVNKDVAHSMNGNQDKHHSAHRIDLVECIGGSSSQYIFGDVICAQGEYQRNCRQNDRTYHVRKEQSQIWFVVRHEFLASGIHEISPLKCKDATCLLNSVMNGQSQYPLNALRCQNTLR